LGQTGRRKLRRISNKVNPLVLRSPAGMLLRLTICLPVAALALAGCASRPVANERDIASSQTGSWRSVATGGDVPVRLFPVLPPQREGGGHPAGLQPLVIYLTNLAAPRVGTDSDEAIIADFRAAGFLVAVIDYRRHERSQWPHLNRDLVELRTQIHRRQFLADQRLDGARIFIVPSGHRLLQDVVFFEDGGRRLAMDVIYPSNPRAPVGAVLEFSCDNENRMGNYSLQYCTDALLEGSAIAGFAVAMADHPVAAPYKGFDPLFDSAGKVKSAIRTLRGLSPRLKLNGKIVTLGFSRGSGMALLAATTMGIDPPNLGDHGAGNTDVSGAVVLSGRFTYLDLLPEDPMIPLYTKAWGDRRQYEGAWKSEGALDWLERPTVPLFLSINVSETPFALHQMNVLRKRLNEVGSPFVYHPETTPRGHRMPLDADVLDPLLEYLRQRLAP
jgi:hypothetical protein